MSAFTRYRSTTVDRIAHWRLRLSLYQLSAEAQEVPVDYAPRPTAQPPTVWRTVLNNLRRLLRL